MENPRPISRAISSDLIRSVLRSRKAFQSDLMGLRSLPATTQVEMIDVRMANIQSAMQNAHNVLATLNKGRQDRDESNSHLLTRFWTIFPWYQNDLRKARETHEAAVAAVNRQVHDFSIAHQSLRDARFLAMRQHDAETRLGLAAIGHAAQFAGTLVNWFGDMSDPFLSAFGY